MSKGRALRGLVMERLVVAADEIFALFERTIAEYEEEARRSKLLLARQNKGVQTLSVNLGIGSIPERTLCIKPGDEPPLEFSLTSVSVKTEDNAEKSSPLQQELFEENREQPGCSLYLQSDKNKQTYSCSDTDDSDDWEPSAKRSTTCDRQESKMVHRKCAKRAFQIHLVNKEVGPALLQSRQTEKINTETSDKWTDAEVPALLSLYASQAIQQDFGGPKRNIRVFGKISTELGNIGIHHTAKQCREKVKKLKQDYRKVKDYNNKNGTYRKSKWFDMLDSILGHCPAYSGNIGGRKDSTVGLLESLCMENIQPPAQSVEKGLLESDGFKRPATVGAPCLASSDQCPLPKSSSLGHPSSDSLSLSSTSSTTLSTASETLSSTGSSARVSSPLSSTGIPTLSTGSFPLSTTVNSPSAVSLTSPSTISDPCLSAASQPTAEKRKREDPDVLSSLENILAQQGFTGINEAYSQQLTQPDVTQAQLRAELAESRSMFVSVMDKLIAVLNKTDTPQ